MSDVSQLLNIQSRAEIYSEKYIPSNISFITRHHI